MDERSYSKDYGWNYTTFGKTGLTYLTDEKSATTNCLWMHIKPGLSMNSLEHIENGWILSPNSSKWLKKTSFKYI